MRERWKLVAVLVAACTVRAGTATAQTATVGTFVTYTEPAGTLIMPFDSTTGHRSFQIVTRVTGNQNGTPVATHWSYWASDCSHLADFFVCLTPNDTAVVDPTALQTEVQVPNPPANVKVGALTDLSGKRGMVTVTAFAADTGPSGRECKVLNPSAVLDSVLVGSWTIANATTNASFGGDAIGVIDPAALPPASILAAGGLRIQTYDPQKLTDSQVILLPVVYPGGDGAFAQTELGPITSKITCDAGFVDNLEIETSIPSLTFKCATFAAISANVAPKGTAPLIPVTTAVTTSGFVHLRNCRTSKGILGNKKFVFAFHGQAVGPFGTLTSGKYTSSLPQS